MKLPPVYEHRLPAIVQSAALSFAHSPCAGHAYCHVRRHEEDLPDVCRRGRHTSIHNIPPHTICTFLHSISMHVPPQYLNACCSAVSQCWNWPPYSLCTYAFVIVGPCATLSNLAYNSQLFSPPSLSSSFSSSFSSSSSSYPALQRDRNGGPLQDDVGAKERAPLLSVEKREIRS